MIRCVGSPKLSRWENLKIGLRLRMHDFQCGRHSGFPLCCVLFYAIRHEGFEPYTGLLPNWLLGLKPEGSYCEPSWLIKAYQKYSDKFGKRGYVACPLCLWMGRFAVTKKCGCYINYLPDGDFFWDNNKQGKHD